MFHPVFVYLVGMAVLFALAAIIVNTRMSMTPKVRSYRTWRKQS